MAKESKSYTVEEKTTLRGETLSKWECSSRTKVFLSLISRGILKGRETFYIIIPGFRAIMISKRKKRKEKE